MTGTSFALDDGAGVSVQLDAASGKVAVTYTPAASALLFTATLKLQSPDALRQIAAECALPHQTRSAASTARLVRLAPRASNAAAYVARRLQSALEWVLSSKENTNFTYDLTPLNMVHLASIVSVVTARPRAEIEGYLAEPAQDAELSAHYAACMESLPPELSAVADPIARWSRRLGWYAIVRALKPKQIVETGVDKGHGALLLCSALKRNAAEGHTGRYVGTDINPKAGYLLQGAYAQYGEVLIGDSIASLKTLLAPIDVFINDSDHSAAYEYNEYQTVAHLLHPASIIIGDNSHVTDKLTQFAAETGRRFLFFREDPQDHWYPGAGIGFAFS